MAKYKTGRPTLLRRLPRVPRSFVTEPSPIEHRVGRIRSWLALSGHSPGQLARMAGMGEGSLRDVHKTNWNPRLHTLLRVERALDYYEVISHAA